MTKARSVIDQLALGSPEVAKQFLAFRTSVNQMGHLDQRQRELCLVSAFATAGDRARMLVHAKRARSAGATSGEVAQSLMICLGATSTLSEVADSLEHLVEAEVIDTPGAV